MEVSVVPLIFLAGLWLAGVAAAQSPDTHQHRFGDAERWARVFDDPTRDAWQKPQQVIEALAPSSGDVIADIGAGTGYFAVRLADAVPRGRVYGVDVEPEMVNYLAARAKREERDNIVAIAGAPDDPRLPEKVDLVLMVDTYHHIDRRAEYFKKLSKALKPDGRVAIIDFRLDAPRGPPRPARVAPERVIAELEGAGYSLVGEHTFLPDQYFLVFRPTS